MKKKEKQNFVPVVMGKLMFTIGICILIGGKPLIAQQNFAAYEDSLKILMQKITQPQHDFERLTYNYEFKKYFEKVLRFEGSADYPFDSLTTVSRLTAPDESFRIFTWFVPLEEGKFEYFGFFQHRFDRRNQVELYTLTDGAARLEQPQYETLDHENWYGAYYTELIHKRYKRNDHYVLLGWRGDNPLTRKRVIEPLSIMEKGRPSFGKPVFLYQDNKHRRIIFEYSARATMAIRYEAHMINQSRRAQDVIVFDRMLPTHDFLKGNYQFYVPETNIFDGFLFEDGKWHFIQDVDARNPRRRPPAQPATVPDNR